MTVMRGPTPEEQTLYEPMLKFFDFAHLPEHLQKVSAPFGMLAYQLVREIERSPERTVALRKLLESKDAAVRAVVYPPG
jgi:hypothetical protein